MHLSCSFERQIFCIYFEIKSIFMLKDRFIPLHDRFCWKFIVIFDNFDLDALRWGNKICCSVFSSEDDSAIGKFMKACWGCVPVPRSDWLSAPGGSKVCKYFEWFCT